MWCIGKITPEYRRRMYDILGLYQEPYDPKMPVVGVDEKPKQLIEDSREPIPMQPGNKERFCRIYARSSSIISIRRKIEDCY